MRLVHTSDWHIGHALGRARRHDEHAAFLDWLADAVEAEGADALVIAGDVFDTQSPTNRAQELYYRFLRRVTAGQGRSRCRHVVVVAGNHDSPTFLNAPRTLLRALDIHVVGAAETEPAEQAIILRDATGAPELAVCAVPHLRDRDIRESAAGESIEDKDRNLIEGIRAHYAAVLAAAETKLAALGANIPVIATGHLFTAGGGGGSDGMTTDDGVRELYVGSLARVPADVFPERFSYVALGHLHAPQIIAGDPARRYSGAPLPMGFDEVGSEKSVVLIDIETGAAGGAYTVRTRTLPVPTFRPMEKITGDWPAIAARLAELAAAGDAAWIAVEYTGDELLPDLHTRVSALVEGSPLDIVKIGNRKLARLALAQNTTEETLDDLDPAAVFDRCLDAHGIAENEREDLRQSYAEILHSLHQSDTNHE